GPGLPQSLIFSAAPAADLVGFLPSEIFDPLDFAGHDEVRAEVVEQDFLSLVEREFRVPEDRVDAGELGVPVAGFPARGLVIRVAGLDHPDLAEVPCLIV